MDHLERYLALEAKINDEKYLLVNIYSPNKDSESVKFYDHLINVFRKDERTFEDKVILGGDFDCPLNPQMDKKKKKNYDNEAKYCLRHRRNPDSF